MPARTQAHAVAVHIAAIGLLAGAAGVALSFTGAGAAPIGIGGGPVSAAAAVRTATPPKSPGPTPTPTPAPSPTGCSAVLFNSWWYCPGDISGVKATTYGTGKRVVLGDVSVTATVPGSRVTLAALAFTPCPPDKFCGATITVESLTIPWSGITQPAPGTVINLFGVTTAGSITPAGYTSSTACYIDYC